MAVSLKSVFTILFFTFAPVLPLYAQTYVSDLTVGSNIIIDCEGSYTTSYLYLSNGLDSNLTYDSGGEAFITNYNGDVDFDDPYNDILYDCSTPTIISLQYAGNYELRFQNSWNCSFTNGIASTNNGEGNSPNDCIFTGSGAAFTYNLTVLESVDPFDNFDLLGTTTPTDVMMSVTGGVQATGGEIWPLVTLLGIPAAFVIGRRVITIIKLMT